MVTKKTIRVMLIDDHKTMLWGLERLIEGDNSGMKVVGMAGSCEEALAQIGELVPDVILLDLDLGGKCSLDILPALLANGVSRALILTATRDQAMLDLAVHRGARGVVLKDASAELVLKAIEKVHQGELWLDNELLGRVFREFMTPKAACKPDPEMEREATLTTRERRIIDTLVAESGALNKVIAQRLLISEYTLRNHLTSIYQKLGLRNRLELYVYAMKRHFGSNSSNCSSTNAAANTMIPRAQRQA